jgi:hypothetical protein
MIIFINELQFLARVLASLLRIPRTVGNIDALILSGFRL